MAKSSVLRDLKANAPFSSRAGTKRALEMGAAGIVATLRATVFGASTWRCAEQVRFPDGSGSRVCDLLTMSTWGSGPFDLHVVEVKCSTADLNAELDAPHKSHPFRRMADFYWLAVGPDVTIDLDGDRVPSRWGVLRVERKGVEMLRAADRNLNPHSLGPAHVAAILRAALNESSHANEPDTDRWAAKLRAL